MKIGLKRRIGIGKFLDASSETCGGIGIILTIGGTFLTIVGFVCAAASDYNDKKIKKLKKINNVKFK